MIIIGMSKKEGKLSGTLSSTRSKKTRFTISPTEIYSLRRVGKEEWLRKGSEAGDT